MFGAKAVKTDNPVQAAPSGMEIMFRSMGLGSIIDTAKQLAENGVFDKIIKFSEQTDGLLERFDKLNARFEEQSIRLDMLQTAINQLLESEGKRRAANAGLIETIYGHEPIHNPDAPSGSGSATLDGTSFVDKDGSFKFGADNGP
jgi:hypothetical protein